MSSNAADTTIRIRARDITLNSDQRRHQQQHDEGRNHETEHDGDGHRNEKLRLQAGFEKERRQTANGSRRSQNNGAQTVARAPYRGRLQRLGFVSFIDGPDQYDGVVNDDPGQTKNGEYAEYG